MEVEEGWPNGWVSLGDAVMMTPEVTGGVTLKDARLFYAAIREEKRVDKAVELLQQVRSEEAEAKALAQAQEVADKVLDLFVQTIEHGAIVRFVKRYGDKDFTYAAVRIVDELGGRWYVTNTSRPRTDADFEDFLAKDGGFEDFAVVYDPVTVEVTEK